MLHMVTVEDAGCYSRSVSTMPGLQATILYGCVIFMEVLYSKKIIGGQSHYGWYQAPKLLTSLRDGIGLQTLSFSSCIIFPTDSGVLLTLYQLSMSFSRTACACVGFAQARPTDILTSAVAGAYEPP